MLDLGGTYRAHSPEETLAKIEPLLWEPFGITRVANITGLDDIDIPTYVAIRPFSKMLTTSQGKGMTPALAKISAIMESIESWHGENLKQPDLYGSYNALKHKYHLVALEKVAQQGVFVQDLASLSEMELPWARGLELYTDKEIYFPMPMINLNSVDPSKNRKIGCFSCTTNGLASGNTYEEALCHALYEVIERHCWAEAELKGPRCLDLATIDSPHLKKLLSYLDLTRIKLDIFDLSNALNVPTYTACLFDVAGFHGQGAFLGTGAHLSSAVAISRAITEAIQSRVTIISGTRDDMYPSVYQSLKSQSIQNYDPKKSFALQESTTVAYQETTVPSDFSSCIETLLNTLRQEFDEIIVYNHTRKEFGVPVVHVIIPGTKFDVYKHLQHSYFPEQLAHHFYYA